VHLKGGLIQIEVTKSFYPQNPEKEQYEVFVWGVQFDVFFDWTVALSWRHIVYFFSLLEISIIFNSSGVLMTL
jgi:hypothetical protein